MAEFVYVPFSALQSLGFEAKPLKGLANAGKTQKRMVSRVWRAYQVVLVLKDSSIMKKRYEAC